VTGPIRIGVDARELLGAKTGVGRYLGELLWRWGARPDAQQRRLILFSPGPVPFFADTVEHRVLPGKPGTWWEQTALRRAVTRDRLDVFFAPAYTAPIGLSIPLAVTIHDISFVAHPEWFRRREGLRRRWLTRRSAAKATVVFTDSEFSRREIETHFQIDPGRIHVIPPAVTPRTLPPREAREPLVLYVGSLFNRRRLPDLIAAFADATADLPHARLAIVGDDRTWPPQDLVKIARAHRVYVKTRFHRYVTDEQLADLYSRASVFAFLSEYEGFGLTPLEALSVGVPPVVLNTAVAREVYGNAAIFVERGDIDATARVLRQLLTDPASAAPVLEAAPAVLGRYSWDAAADETLAHIERIARR
jgi:glycosyltransferase involved in cell wall biosynthesis